MAIGSGGEEQRHRHACSACKHQGKKCDENCVLAQYFPAGKDQEFNAVHKVFGVKNLTKILKGVADDQRKEAADTLIWEAMAWKEDPLQGPRGLYNKVIAELNIIQQHHLAMPVRLCFEDGTKNRNNVRYSQGTGFPITPTSMSFPNYPIGAGNVYNFNPNFGQSCVPIDDYSINIVDSRQIGYKQKMADLVRPPVANFNPDVGPNKIQNGEEIKRNELLTNYQQYSFNPNYLSYNYQDLGVQERKYQHSTGETSRSKEYQQADTGHRGWVAPPPGWVKINIDGSGDCIGGGICRNSLGKCLFGFTIHQRHGSNELGAQFQAIIKGLIEAWTRCHRKIIIETNSLEVLYSITNLKDGVRPQDFFMHLSKIKELLERDWCCRVEHVGNEANLCANWLATMFAHESPGDCFFEVPPNSIVGILEKDLAGIPTYD